MPIIVVGITLKDIESNYFVKRESTKACKAPIPFLTSSLESWPESTKYKCWYCHKDFEGKPIPIIVVWETKKNKGYACCLSEAKRYLLSYKDPSIDQKNINKHIDDFYRGCSYLGLIEDGLYILEADHFYLQDPNYGYV